jgi:hypothetical protein
VQERAIETIMRVRVGQNNPGNALMKMDIMTKETSGNRKITSGYIHEEQ